MKYAKYWMLVLLTLATAVVTHAQIFVSTQRGSTNMGMMNVEGSTLNVSATNTLAMAISGVMTNFGTNAITGLVNTVGTNQVGGFTVITNILVPIDSTAGGIASGDALAPEVQVPGAVRAGVGSGVLQCLTLINNTNASPTFNLLVCSAPITWPSTNVAVNLVGTELMTNVCTAPIKSSDGTWQAFGTNNIWFASNLGRPIKCASTTLYLYFVNAAAITNLPVEHGSGNVPSMAVGIYQD